MENFLNLTAVYTNLRGESWPCTVITWSGEEMLISFDDDSTILRCHISKVTLIVESVLEEVVNRLREEEATGTLKKAA